MKRLRLLVALAACAVALAGCQTLNYDDRVVLKQHNVSEVLFDKMAHGEILEVPDVIELSQRGVPPAFIIRYIRISQNAYRLKVEEVTALKKGGVSPDVINYMLATASMYGPSPYYYPPPYPYPYGGGFYDAPPVIFVSPGFHGHH